MKHKLQQGLIQIYTGNGKGKTTAAIGLANRAAAHGFKVIFIQFLKASHDQATMKQNPKIEYKYFGLPHEKYGWLTIGKDGKTQNPHLTKFQACIDKAWQFTNAIITKGEYDLIILDELNLTLYFKLLDIQEVIDTLSQRAKHTEIVITGRNSPRELIDIADLVTEMKEVKHPYQKGIEAREGIEY